jgi:hypothetical protein
MLAGMSLIIEPSEFSQPDFAVTWREADGRAVRVGRISRANAGAPDGTPWVWTIDLFQRAGRAEPHQGHAASEDEARAKWQEHWDSADVPVRWPPVRPASSG